MNRLLSVFAISITLTSCAKAEETFPFAIAAPDIVDSVQAALSETAICSVSADVAEAIRNLDETLSTQDYAWTCLPKDQTILVRAISEKTTTTHSRSALREAGMSLAENLPTWPVNLSSLGRTWGPPEFPAADQTVSLLQSTVDIKSDAALFFLGASGRYVEILPLTDGFTTNLENAAVSRCQDTVAGVCRAGAFFNGTDVYPTYVRP